MQCSVKAWTGNSGHVRLLWKSRQKVTSRQTISKSNQIRRNISNIFEWRILLIFKPNEINSCGKKQNVFFYFINFEYIYFFYCKRFLSRTTSQCRGNNALVAADQQRTKNQKKKTGRSQNEAKMIRTENILYFIIRDTKLIIILTIFANLKLYNHFGEQNGWGCRKAGLYNNNGCWNFDVDW